MAKETRIGLAVIAVLLVGFSTVLIMKKKNPSQVADGSADEDGNEDDDASDEGDEAEDLEDEEEDDSDEGTEEDGEEEDDGDETANDARGKTTPRPALNSNVSKGKATGPAGTTASKTGSGQTPTAGGLGAKRLNDKSIYGGKSGLNNKAATATDSRSGSSSPVKRTVAEAEVDDDADEEDEDADLDDAEDDADASATAKKTGPTAKAAGAPATLPERAVGSAAGANTAKANENSASKGTNPSGGSAASRTTTNSKAAAPSAGNPKSSSTGAAAKGALPGAKSTTPSKDDKATSSTRPLAGQARPSTTAAGKSDVADVDEADEDEADEDTESTEGDEDFDDDDEAGALAGDEEEKTSRRTDPLSRPKTAATRRAIEGASGDRFQRDSKAKAAASPPTRRPGTLNARAEEDEDDGDDEEDSSAVGTASSSDDAYDVNRGDTFASIARDFYDDTKYAEALWRHNRATHANMSELRDGDRILVPPPEELERKYPNLIGSKTTAKTKAPERSAPIAGKASSRSKSVSGNKTRESSAAIGSTRGDRTERTGTTRSRGRTYIVQEGDTLFDIARNELGSARRWAELYDLNIDVLGDDFTTLDAGVELTLPGDEAAEGPEPESRNATKGRARQK